MISRAWLAEKEVRLVVVVVPTPSVPVKNDGVVEVAMSDPTVS